VGLGLGLGLVAAVGVLALWWTVRADDPQPSTLAVGVAAAAMPSGIQHATAAVSTSTSSPSTTVRPRLALQGVDVEPGDGVLVMMVAASGSADRAGVQPGDVILAVDDQDVTTMDELITVLGRHPFGDTVTVTLERADRVLRVPVTLDDM
jgi:S1-C subfamily serine protease